MMYGGMEIDLSIRNEDNDILILDQSFSNNAAMSYLLYCIKWTDIAWLSFIMRQVTSRKSALWVYVNLTEFTLIMK